MGVYSALGKGIQNNFQKLTQSNHALSSIEFLDTIHKNQFPFGEIKKSTKDLKKDLEIAEHQIYTRTSLLGISAMQEALNHASIEINNKYKIGLINATTVGSMCEVERFYDELLTNFNNYKSYADSIDCADCTQLIADYFKVKDFVTTISTACSSAANAIILGSRLIEHGILDIAICGGTDALTKFTINGFNALKNIDKNFCRPFDANRNGLNLGEGAAYIILERESNCLNRKHTPIASLVSYCNFNESFHPTAPNPQGEGAYQVMKRAIEKAKLKTTEIDYINSHGTATITNDESEANAMKRLFEKVPAFSSTKCYTGHTLGAAAAIEAVFSILALNNQAVYANLHFETPIEESLLVPQLKFEKKQLKYVMSNSFAFGGNNASLIFSNYPS